MKDKPKPPPIPGMRPPLGSPGGPVAAPKSSMGFIMPIYTVCIVVFFVYTLSKILFKRTATPYEPVPPDPCFRRRVFRGDSRTSPDKLGPKERDAIVTAISGLVAEVQDEMEASEANSQRRQEAENHPRPYTNGTVLHDTGPVHIVTSEYREASKEKEREPTPAREASPEKEKSPEPIHDTPEPVRESAEDTKEIPPQEVPLPEEDETVQAENEYSNEITKAAEIDKESDDDLSPSSLSPSDDDIEVIDNKIDEIPSLEEIAKIETEKLGTNEIETEKIETEKNETPEIETAKIEIPGIETEKNEVQEIETANAETREIELEQKEDDLLTGNGHVVKDNVSSVTEEFLNEAKALEEDKKTENLLEEAIKDVEDELDNGSVKVVGMELTTHAADGGTWHRPSPPVTPAPAAAAPSQARPHEAEEVKSIYLEAEIPQKSRVLVADFGEDRPEAQAPASDTMVVSGKMTLSLIQDEQRDTPEREPESTVDDFTTASAVTQPAAEKQAVEESDEEEEIEEEIEVEEIEEEVEVEEEELEEDEEQEKQENGPTRGE